MYPDRKTAEALLTEAEPHNPGPWGDHNIKYGNRKMNERTGTKTQALCAVRISFLDIPEENTLHYLSGKVIKLKDPQIVKQFDGLDKNKQAPAEEK